MRISTTLTLVFSVVIIALVSSNILSYRSEKQALTVQVLNHLESVASIQHARLESIVEQNYERFQLVSSRTQMRLSLKAYLHDGNSLHLGKIHRILQDARNSISSFSRIDLLNLDGSIVASTEEGARGALAQYLTEDCYMKARQGETLTEFSLNPDGSITQHLAGPITLDGKMLGVMIIDSDAKTIIDAVQDYSGLGQTGETVLAVQNDAGDVMFLMPTRFDSEAALRRIVSSRTSNLAIVQSFQGGEKFLTDIVDYRDEAVLAVTHFVAPTGWGLVVKIDAAEAFAPVRELRNTLFVILSGCGFLIAVSFFCLMRTITLPITELIKVSCAIAQGKVMEASANAFHSEIGLLGQAFNTMTQKITAANVELEQTIEELRTEINERKTVEAALKINEERLESLLLLHDLKNSSEKELQAYALEESVKITNSKIGYFHFVNEDEQTGFFNSWSKETVSNCTVSCDSHFAVENAGIWADCIRLRQFVIHNDYPNCPDKKGFPEGHIPLSRHMSVPIFDNEKIIAVVGVGNKELPYENSDARQLSLFFSTVWDMVKQKRAAEEKATLERQLHQAQKMESIGTLAGGIAHDFNNILSAVLGYTELAQGESVGQKQLSEYLAEVFKAGNRAKELVKQILTFSRQNEHEMKPLQVHLVVKEALKLLRSSIPTTIDIRQDIDPRSGTILADPIQIHQVLMNLCTNAYQAMRDRGGVLGVELKNIEIDIDDEKVVNLHLAAGNYVRLSVCDTGVGLERSTMDKIFEPYFTTKKKGEGTGLGLALVHGIVKSHGGHISVYSELGKGTTFHVYLPQVHTKDVAAETLVGLQDIPKGHEQILLIDDEDQIAQMHQAMLIRLGYQVTVMTSAAQALAAFTSRPQAYDLVITDMTMPDMTGAELSQKMLALRADLPIILCTGFSELINKESAKSIGIRELIMKPLTHKELADSIRRVLDTPESGR